MSESNGVIRIGRKGIKKFAFGDEGAPFEIDVVMTFQQWASIDEGFRDRTEDGTIATADMKEYHEAAVMFAAQCAGTSQTAGIISTAEALDFIARIREQYDEVSRFFRPKSLEKPDSAGTSGVDMVFSEEEGSVH